MDLDGLKSVKKRLDYLLTITGVMIITGDVGSGKSTSLRYGVESFHPSEHVIVKIIATSGSPPEFYRQIAWGLGIAPKGVRLTQLQKDIRTTVEDIVRAKRKKVILVVDEAHLLRSTALAEIHTLGQVQFDSKPRISLVLCGQTSLLDQLCHRSCASLRARTHLTPLAESKTRDYIEHHLKIAGCRKGLFSDAAFRAIHQGSAGCLRRINHLCRGGMIAANLEKDKSIEAQDLFEKDFLRQ